MSDAADPRLDILAGEDASDAASDGSPRPWLGIHFDCCGVYARIYRDAQGTRYEGACPRCRRVLSVPVGPDGTAQRIFRAS